MKSSTSLIRITSAAAVFCSVYVAGVTLAQTPAPTPTAQSPAGDDGWRTQFQHTLGGEVARRVNIYTGEVQPLGVHHRSATRQNSVNSTQSDSNAQSSVIATINTPGRPHGIAINPATGLGYATGFDTDALYTINLATNVVVTTTNTASGAHPHSIAVNTANSRVYATNIDGDSVSIMNGQTGAIIATVPNIAGHPVGIDVDGTRNRAYAVHSANSLTPIESNNTAGTTLITGGSNGYVAINPVANKAYVSKNNPNGIIAVMNLATNALEADIAVGGHVSDLAVNPGTNRAYSANDSTGRVNVINTQTNQVVTSVTVGSAPSDVAVNQATNCVFVANENGNSVTVIDGSNNGIVETIAVGSGPKAIAVNPTTNRVYVANKNDSTISVIQITDCTAATPTAVPSPVVNTPQPPNTPAATLPEATTVFNRKVFVLVFDPRKQDGTLLRTDQGWNFHEDITRETIAFYKSATRNRLNYTVVGTSVAEEFPAKLDGFRYTADSWIAAKNSNSFHFPDEVNYTAILTDPRWNLCARANRGDFDEVWIYNGPYFGFYESTLAGPNAYWYNSNPVQGAHGCTRLVPIMGPSVERTTSEAIHNFGHRTEAAMTQVYGSWDSRRIPTHNWERYAIAKVNSNGAVDYSGCGAIHEPPNAAAPFDYANPANPTRSNCAAWNAFPNVPTASTYGHFLTCAAWGCNSLDFYRYWFLHMPHFTGCTTDNGRQVLNDWLAYMIIPEYPITSGATLCTTPPIPTTAVPTATSTATRTPTTTPRPPTTTAVPTATSTATRTTITPQPPATTAVPTPIPTTAVPTTIPTTVVPTPIATTPIPLATTVIPTAIANTPVPPTRTSTFTPTPTLILTPRPTAKSPQVRVFLPQVAK
jgi:YVTN family beta-propeller protein